jgi:hypothetical protein
MFVALGFLLFSCGPKRPRPKPEEEVKETASIFEMGKEEEAGTIQRESVKVVEGTLLVADFDSGEKPNNVGGDLGAWNSDANDFSQGCFESFVSTIAYGGQGYSLQLMYDVDSPNPAYNGFWMKLNGIDLSGYKNLSFWVKGDEVRGFTKVFKVELKNKERQVGKFYVTDISSDWQNVVIPLEKFSELRNFSSMDEFVIVFEDRVATRKEGAIYIDNVAFTR